MSRVDLSSLAEYGGAICRDNITWLSVISYDSKCCLDMPISDIAAKESELVAGILSLQLELEEMQVAEEHYR